MPDGVALDQVRFHDDSRLAGIWKVEVIFEQLHCNPAHAGLVHVHRRERWGEVALIALLSLVNLRLGRSAEGD